MTLQNHMVTPSAAPDGPDDPRPLREEVCVSCNLIGYKLEDSDWVYDVRVVRAADGPYLAGEDLPEADDSPMGWVCSDRCRSQAMYDKATPEQKEALDKVRDACMVLAEYGKVAVDLVNEQTSHTAAPLGALANLFLEAIHDTPNDPPEWCNRPLYADRLARVAERASRRLRSNALELGIRAKFGMIEAVYPMRWENRVRIQDHARLAASCALLAEDLNAAEEGHDA